MAESELEPAHQERIIWRRGWRPPGVRAEAAAAELERLHKQDGGLTATGVLEAATPEDSPLHSAFTWDDTEAAHQHRLAEARRIVKSIRIVRQDGSGHPMFYSIAVTAAAAADREEGTGRQRSVYRLASDIAQDEEAVQGALKVLVEKATALQNAVEEFRALLDQGDARMVQVAAMAAALTTVRTSASRLAAF